MSEPKAPLIEEVDVMGVLEDGKFKTIGMTEPYQGVELKHQLAKTSNAIGNGKQYTVKVVDGLITTILVDFSKLQQAQLQQAAEQRMKDVAQELETATTIVITWVDNFHDHTESLSLHERSKKAEEFLREAKGRIESSKTVGEFALLVTDLDGKTGSGQSVWRLCGRITGRIPAQGIVKVLLWHYGPGSRH